DPDVHARPVAHRILLARVVTRQRIDAGQVGIVGDLRDPPLDAHVRVPALGRQDRHRDAGVAAQVLQPHAVGVEVHPDPIVVQQVPGGHGDGRAVLAQGRHDTRVGGGQELAEAVGQLRIGHVASFRGSAVSVPPRTGPRCRSPAPPWSASSVTRMTTRTERLDDLPFTPKHRRLLLGSGVGWALDAMDVGLISFVMAALAVHWSLTPTELSWIGSIGFVGMAIGAALGGLLADRIGRRQVFAATLLVYGLATGAAALSVSVGMLIVLRFIVGLGLGAELPVASTLVSEFAPRTIRGRVVVALEAF